MKAEVRLASEKDVPTLSEWAYSTKNNLLDPKIAEYPNLRVLAADVNGEPALYVPFHPVMIVESLAIRPGSTPKENAYALRKIQDALEKFANVYGMAEIWWQCADDSLIKLAEHHGYEVVTTKVLRKKVTPCV